jgi:hypothetical protein
MTEDQMIEQCAKAAHEVNRGYCAALGDDSQPPWSDAPDWQKDSARNGVRAALNPDQTPEMSHQGWMAQKEAEGWVFGEVKDPEKKTHPCMVPYDQLPESQRAKDSIFINVVRQTKAAIDAAFDAT